jgi:hypothetical protein
MAFPFHCNRVSLLNMVSHYHIAEAIGASGQCTNRIAFLTGFVHQHLFCFSLLAACAIASLSSCHRANFML